MKIVAAALIFDGPNVLIARRAPGQNLAGFWEFPGGKLERGETLKSCLSRELDEELGLECEVLDMTQVAMSLMSAHGSKPFEMIRWLFSERLRMLKRSSASSRILSRSEIRAFIWPRRILLPSKPRFSGRGR